MRDNYNWSKYSVAGSDYSESNEYKYCGKLEKMVDALSDIVYDLQKQIEALRLQTIAKEALN